MFENLILVVFTEECLHCDRDAHCVGGHCICKHGFVGDGLDCWGENATVSRKNIACCLLITTLQNVFILYFCEKYKLSN